MNGAVLRAASRAAGTNEPDPRIYVHGGTRHRRGMRSCGECGECRVWRAAHPPAGSYPDMATAPSSCPSIRNPAIAIHRYLSLHPTCVLPAGWRKSKEKKRKETPRCTPEQLGWRAACSTEGRAAAEEEGWWVVGGGWWMQRSALLAINARTAVGPNPCR